MKSYNLKKDFKIESITKSGGLFLRHIDSPRKIFVNKKLTRLFLNGLYDESFKFFVTEETWNDGVKILVAKEYFEAIEL